MAQSCSQRPPMHDMFKNPFDRMPSTTHRSQPSFSTDSSSPTSPPSPTAPVSSSAPNRSPVIPAESRPISQYDATQSDAPSARGSIAYGSSRRRSTTDRSADTQKIRRRNRMITSCLECRRRKLKCDRSHPCSNCAKAHRECLFLAPALDPASRQKLALLKDKMGTLERSLEWDILDRRRSSDGYYSGGEGQDVKPAWGNEDPFLPVPEDEKDIKPNPLAVPDAGYGDDTDDDDVETYELGFKLGKLRITDRLGGFVRPRIPDELSAVLTDLSIKEEGSPQPGIQRPRPPHVSEISPEEKSVFFQPSAIFAAPRTELILGPRRPYSVRDYLPSQAIADLLFKHYLEAVHYAARVVHRPTFEKQYADFWSIVLRGEEPPASLQALVFAALFSAVATVSEDVFMRTFGSHQRKLLDSFHLACEMALAKAHVIKTGKTQTLQALVMYLIPMCRTEISRGHSVLVGAAIRLAECMGLHRDPEEFGFSPIDCHVRRMIWYQLCYLDIRTSEVQGPKATITRESFSTKFPLNVDDAELMRPEPPRTDESRWTDMTLSRIRIECQEMHRIIYVDRLRLDKKQTTLTTVLSNVESFRKAMETKYGPLVDVPNPTPLQRVAKLTMAVLISRCYIILLHRYHTSASTPDRLRQLNLICGAEQLEKAIELETDPTLQPWHWVSSAINLNHISLLLLSDVYMHPMRKEADRLFRAFDYIFEVPPHLREPVTNGGDSVRRDLASLRNAKASHILEQFRDRFAYYLEARKLKVPLSISNKSPQRPIYEDEEDCNDPSSASNSLLTKIKDEFTKKSRATFHPRARVAATSAQPYPSVQAPAPPRAGGMPYRPSRHILSRNASFDAKVPVDAASDFVSAQAPVTQPPAPMAMQMPSNGNASTSSLAGNTGDMRQYPPYSGAEQLNPRASFGPAYQGQQFRPPTGHSSETSSASSPDTFHGGQPLWFVPGVSGAGAGLASQVTTPGGFAPGVLMGLNNNNGNVQHGQQLPLQVSQQDLPMSDIDWSEWDKLFPPDVNNGEINLPSLPAEAPAPAPNYNNNQPVIFQTPDYSQYNNYPFTMQSSLQQQQAQQPPQTQQQPHQPNQP